MNISEVLKKHEKLQQKELYTVRGNITSFDKENITSVDKGTIKIEFSPYAYALVDEQEIDPFLIFPLNAGEDPSGRNSKHAIKIIEGTKIELHVKSVVHTFIAENSTRPFYICESKEEIVYLNNNVEHVDDESCNKKVYVADCHCCSGGYLEKCYGWVGCSAGWFDRRCCD